jgi:Holliday junction resolvase
MNEKESDIQRAILDYLSIKRIFHWRNNSGALKTEGGHFVRFGAVGSPDIFALHKGVLYAIEVKTKKGRVSDAQAQFLVQVNRAGGVPLVARSLDDVMKKLP